MSYVNAPATKLLASHCAVCHRPLLDAISVETGIGPVCRDRHGYKELELADEETRAAANQIICRVARPDVPECEVAAACAALRLMGFKKLADRIEFLGHDAPKNQVVTMRVSSRNTGWYIKAPWKPAAVASWRNIPTRKWDGEAKENFVGFADRRMLWQLLRTHYAGCLLIRPDGTSVTIEEPEGRAEDVQQVVKAYVDLVREERGMQRMEAEADREQTLREERAKFAARQALEQG